MTSAQNVVVKSAAGSEATRSRSDAETTTGVGGTNSAGPAGEAHTSVETNSGEAGADGTRCGPPHRQPTVVPWPGVRLADFSGDFDDPSRDGLHALRHRQPPSLALQQEDFVPQQQLALAAGPDSQTQAPTGAPAAKTAGINPTVSSSRRIRCRVAIVASSIPL